MGVEQRTAIPVLELEDAVLRAPHPIRIRRRRRYHRRPPVRSAFGTCCLLALAVYGLAAWLVIP